MRCKLHYKIKKINYFSNVDCEAIRAQNALKLGRLLSFLSRNALNASINALNASMWKNLDRGRTSIDDLIILFLLRLLYLLQSELCFIQIHKREAEIWQFY